MRTPTNSYCFSSASTLLSRYNVLNWLSSALRKPMTATKSKVRLQVESMEDRLVPSFSMDIELNDSTTVPTIVSGQQFAVTTQTFGDTVTPTGTITFTIIRVGALDPTLATEPLSPVGSGYEADSTPDVISLAAATYHLTAHYSGDTNYSADSVTDTIVVSEPTNITVDPAPGTSSCSCAGPVADPTPIATPAAAVSAAGVDYSDGAVKVTREDLSSGGFVTPYGETWTWTNESGFGDSTSGSGATQTQAPHLVELNGTDSIAMVVNSQTAYDFDLIDGSYVSRFGDGLNMMAETVDGYGSFVVTDGAGNTFTFFDFSGGAPGETGELSSMTDSNGDATSVTSWSSAGSPTEVEQSSGSGSSEATMAFVSTYISSGVNAGLLSSVTQESKIGSGSWSTVSTSTYTYYTDSDTYGQAGELMTEITTDASSNILSGAYYRYYTSGASAGLLEYSFSTASYERLTAAWGTDLDSLSDSDVSPYADTYLEYNSSGQVSDAVDAGAGCSVCSGGLGTYSYTYSTNSSFYGIIDPNTWVHKTVETLPDDNENIVYTNYAGQTMMSVYEDTTTDQQWCTYYQYNSAGQVILEADPSAVTGYSESDDDLVGWSGGSATYLSSDSGLITTYSYGTSTTATSSTAGDVSGYLQETAIQQGTDGTSIPQESYTYYSNTAGGATVFNVAADTVYRNSDGTGEETTSYSYSYYSGTNEIYSKTATLPIITTAQNGSNSANTTETVYSQNGQVIWEMDANGYLSYMQYDSLTGAVTEQIQDVNTSDASDFTNLPTGWSTPTGGGLNLVTSYQVDSLGRVTEQTNPNGTIDYTVYDDADNEVRTYSGWNSTTDLATGPTEVTIDDMAAGYTENLTMTATPDVTSGVPTGGEWIAGVLSLSRSYTNDAGQTIEVDDYFNLGGLTYISGTLGTSGVNYYATLYAYDADGNMDKTVDAQGTITRTVYNGQHQEVSIWVGTDDTPATGYWSPTNNTSPSNMVETESFVYDNGGVGDGDLTQVTQYPGGSANNHVTDYWYNWEDEKVAEKDGVSSTETDGVNRPLTVWTYDNLGEVTETQVYSGDGVTPTISSGVLSLPSGTSSDLQSQAVTSYNNQGNVYETQVYSVNPTNGDVSSAALTTNYYYDADGQQIAESAPGGLWTKDVYDGAGREVMEYQTDGGSGTSYADAGTVSSDVALSQTQTVYDGDGNVVETITKDRFNTDSGTATGALGTHSSGVEARVYYSGNYYDLADRLIASVDVGTNSGSAWTMPSSAPSRSSTTLVTTYSYAADALQEIYLTGAITGGTFTLTFGGDTTSAIAYNATASTVQSDLAALASIGSGNVVVAQAVGGAFEVRFASSLAGTYQNQLTATSSLTGTLPGITIGTISLGGDNGNVVDTVDPNGLDARSYYDGLGRAVQSIDDFTNGAVTDDSNKTTDYTYNSAGMTSLTAEMTGGVGETTQWVYGVTTASGSTIDSNDVVSATEQPNPSTGLPDSGIATTVTVDALGDTLTITDADGTTHTYTYDVLGQQTLDDVTTLGSGVDGTVREIATAYDTLGDAYLVTSYNSSSGVVNQVENVYNGLDQLMQQYQAVGGSVSTSTTPSVQYDYTDLSGGNNSRLTEIVYPDGYAVDYNYSSGLNSNISRLSSLSDDTGTLESYQYLGLSTIVEMDHPESGINLTYISQTGSTGSSGDQYTGLDQFGRVIEQNWYDSSTSSSVVDLKYGYDDDGNVLYRQDTVDSAMSELYSYDGLNQIVSFERGTLNGSNTAMSGTPSESETWTYDPLGNHTSDDTTIGSTTTDVTSTFNFQNEITSMSGSTTPAYDASGNTTTDQSGLQYVYDAWGRLVKVENSSGSTLETYSYDGLGNRMTNTVGSTTTDLYNSTAGQVLEEASGGYYTTRYVWNPAYVNEMVDRDTDNSGTGLTATGSSYTRLFPATDDNYDVVALLNTSGSVLERYSYDPFAAQTVMTGSYGTQAASGYNWVYGFQGGRLDAITLDTVFGVRNEDPQTGEWTSIDPVGFQAGDDDLYRLEGNNPTIHTDPLGLDSAPFSIVIKNSDIEKDLKAWGLKYSDKLKKILGQEIKVTGVINYDCKDGNIVVSGVPANVKIEGFGAKIAPEITLIKGITIGAEDSINPDTTVSVKDTPTGQVATVVVTYVWSIVFKLTIEIPTLGKPGDEKAVIVGTGSQTLTLTCGGKKPKKPTDQ